MTFKACLQEFAPVESSVTVKVKGTSRSRLPENLNLSRFMPDDSWRDLYNRVWDVADYVIPPAENGAFFITTNLVITPNQVQFQEEISFFYIYCIILPAAE